MNTSQNVQEMGVISRWVRGLGVLGGLMRAPNQLDRALEGGSYLNAGAFPKVFALFQRDDVGKKLLQEKPLLCDQTVDFNALRALPDGTLGREFARFYEERGLSLEVFQKAPALPNEDAVWVVKRLRQTHDIWHILTGYETDIPGELVLQAFTYGQLGVPSALVLSSLGSLRYAPKHPGLVRLALDAYRRGKSAKCLAAVHWESLWGTPVRELQARFGLLLD